MKVHPDMGSLEYYLKDLDVNKLFLIVNKIGRILWRGQGRATR